MRHSRVRNRVTVLALIALIVIGLLIGTYVLTQEDETPAEQTHVTLFLSYVPSVQFAPIYIAKERGYFADEGIDLEIENSFNEADGVQRLGSNDLQFGIFSGEQVVLGRAQNLPLVYIMEWYHRFPVGIVSPVEQGITEPADLAGHIVGVPGPFGANYLGLRALLADADLTEADLGELRSIGFAAPEAICEGQVEAAAVYIANEPLTIEQQCTEVNVIEVSDYTNLVANGLVTNETTISDNPDLVRGMVRAILHGVADTLADPDAVFEVSVEKYVTDLPEDQYDTQRQVLQNSLALWQSDQPGATDPEAWNHMQTILLDTGLLSAPLDDLSAGYNMSFLPD
ncbi:MAG TPA: ABC transporter substrate-binding protein [Aggregatilinea sp.]|uniref:ABC transporter substrate-binding protein n=1 Tax=Aggregatilinea sp. TaxID=2806333 RepID=UPI002C39DBEC|nr:ABC transporter substrate-binding protein [Aggregatilinea sp.]HML24073.1 ABC transporter substrate-binding protein [Aggregatilinea sp.]